LSLCIKCKSKYTPNELDFFVGLINVIDLPYPIDALEPYYSKETLLIHFDKLYAGYVDKTNQTEEKIKQARANNDFRIL
jgi:Fe-Mn family superoxide dismutase